MKIFDDIPCSEISHCIDEWIKSDRNRKIMKRRHIDGISYEKLAEECGLSIRQVKNIVKSQDEIIASKMHF